MARQADGRIGRRRPARLVLAGLLALATLAGAQAQDLVQGVQGLAVAPAPGQPPARRLRGDLALRLAQEQLDGRTWSQLLGSDGSAGWTAQPVPAGATVTARPRGSGLELMPVPPGSPDFEASTSLPVADGSSGTLTGGSRTSRVATTQDLLVPDWLNPSLAPWPRWRLGAVEGYAPLDALALDWPRARAAAGDVAADVLRQAGLLGLARAPFLAAVAPALARHAPAAGDRTLDLSGAPDQAVRVRPATAGWTGPLAAYLPVAGRAGWSSLLQFAQGGARAFVLARAGGAPLVLTADEDDLAIVRVDEADLDGDGQPEWLLEVVGTYGDGYYSELWIVDGRAPVAGGVARVVRQALSRGSGETARAQLAAWWVDGPGKTLWVWRSTAQGSRLQGMRWGAGRLRAAAAGAAVVLGTDRTATAAGQRLLATPPDLGAAAAVPHGAMDTPHWSTVLPFATVAEARRWAGRQGLPAAAVRPLPWRP